MALPGALGPVESRVTTLERWLRSISLDTGDLAGWTVINNTYITGGAATLDSEGVITLGEGDDVVVLDSVDPGYRLWAGRANAADAPFRVTKAGVLTAQGAAIEGALTATTGALVDLDVSGVLSLIEGGAIQSDGYETGVKGWRIDYDGSAEFSDITARGAIKNVVFEKGSMAATAGSILVTKSAGKLAADYTVGDTLTIETPDEGGFLFDDDDVVRIAAINTGGGLTTTWVVVTRTLVTNEYTTSYASGANSVTYPAGTVAVDYGASGDGLLELTADAANGPFYSVQTHAGAPYTALTEHVRLGNLNGILGYAGDAYGIAIGNDESTSWLSYDQTNGLRITGNALLEGTVTVAQLNILGKELIVNGGFENPLENGWAHLDTAVGVRTTAQAHTGAYSLSAEKALSGAALAAIQYVYDVIPRAQIIAAVDVLGAQTGGRVRIDIEYYNDADSRIGYDRKYFTVTTAWEKCLVPGTVMVGTSYIRYMLWVWDDVLGTVYFDNASLMMKGGLLETVETDLVSSREFFAPGAAEYRWCNFYSRAFDAVTKEHIAIQHDVPSGWNPETDVIVEALFGGKVTQVGRDIVWGMSYNCVGPGDEAWAMPYSLSAKYSGVIDDSIVSRIIIGYIPAAHIISEGKMAIDFYREATQDNYDYDACLIGLRFTYTLHL